MRPARYVPDVQELTEKAWQQQVVELARTLGWVLYHTYDSRRSQPGFPDLVLVRERVVFLELKRESGKLTAPQRVWVERLDGAGAEVYVARPSDWDDLGKILAARRHSAGLSIEAGLAATSLRERSLRTPGQLPANQPLPF